MQQAQGRQADARQQELPYRHQVKAFEIKDGFQGHIHQDGPHQGHGHGGGAAPQIVHRRIHEVGQGDLKEHPHQAHLHGDDAGVEQHLFDGLLGVGPGK